MQCLPTQAITRRETGGWRWPAFQLGYMTLLAYVSALSVYQVLSRLGIS
jgi:ferrous iron transport protein B